MQHNLLRYITQVAQYGQRIDPKTNFGTSYMARDKRGHLNHLLERKMCPVVWDPAWHLIAFSNAFGLKFGFTNLKKIAPSNSLEFTPGSLGQEQDISMCEPKCESEGIMVS